MIVFLSYLSANTPAHSETNTCGTSVAKVEIVIQKPDEVVTVIYQIIEKPTTDEPKIDKFWLIMNHAICFCQFACPFIVSPLLSLLILK